MPKPIREMDWTGGDPPIMIIMLVGDGEKSDEPWRCMLCRQPFPGASIAIMLGSPDNVEGRMSLHLRCAEALQQKLRSAVRAVRETE